MGWAFFAGTYLSGCVGAFLLAIKNKAVPTPATVTLCICWPVLLILLIIEYLDENL